MGMVTVAVICPRVADDLRGHGALETRALVIVAGDGGDLGAATTGSTIATPGTATTGGGVMVHHGAKGLLVNCAGLVECRLQVSGIVLTTHPEVGEVVDEEAEQILAILAVLSGIQDVGMPHLVGHGGGYDHLLTGDRQEQEASVVFHQMLRLLQGPPFTLFFVHELDHDRLEIELPDLLSQLGNIT